jgi:hypothetical protein
MSDVYAALAYHWDHRGEIQRRIAKETAFVEEMKRKHPSPLKEKLAAKDAPNNSLPS